MPALRRPAALLVTALLVLPLVGCIAPPPEEPQALIPVVTGETPSEDAIMLADGMSPDEAIARAVELLPGIAETTLDATGVPGMAVAVVHGGETIYTGGFGVRRLGGTAPVTPETVFQIASVSKSLSATVIAHAVSEGIVDWQTPVHELMPEFAVSDPVVTERATIADYFAHRSGLATGSGDDLEDLGFDRATILERLRLLPLDSFRVNYHYSNFGIQIGAEAVARAAGEEWEDLADRLLFEPLGMTSTSARESDFRARDNRADLHARVGDGFEPIYERHPDPEAAAGGVSSSVIDLATWMRLILAEGAHDGGTLFAPEALLPAVSAQIVSSTPHAVTARPGHYGYGFNVSSTVAGRVSLNHSGAFIMGAGTTFQLIPSLDVGIVVLTNGAPVGAAESVAAQFLDIVQFGDVTRDWTTDYGAAFAPYFVPVGDLAGLSRPAGARAPAALTEYAGTYRNDYFGDLLVTEGATGLVAIVGPDALTMPLDPWDGDTFAFTRDDENTPPGSLSSAAFQRTGERVTSVTLDIFDSQGMGTWTRE